MSYNSDFLIAAFIILTIVLWQFLIRSAQTI